MVPVMFRTVSLVRYLCYRKVEPLIYVNPLTPCVSKQYMNYCPYCFVTILWPDLCFRMVFNHCYSVNSDWFLPFLCIKKKKKNNTRNKRRTFKWIVFLFVGIIKCFSLYIFQCNWLIKWQYIFGSIIAFGCSFETKVRCLIIKLTYFMLRWLLTCVKSSIIYSKLSIGTRL